jgi:hypothetical protein
VLAPDKVKVVEAEFIVKAPAPEIAPPRIWFVDDVCEYVVELPSEIVLV